MRTPAPITISTTMAVCLMLMTIMASGANCAPSCPVLPENPILQDWKSKLLRFHTAAQGKLKYGPLTDESQTSLIQMQRQYDTIEGIAGRALNFLLVRKAGPSDYGAIEITASRTQPFSCFARAGDVVLIRTAFGVSHITTLYSVNVTQGQVEIIDPWPDRFAWLEGNSGGIYHGAIKHQNNFDLVLLPLEEFDSSLWAIFTIDLESFARALLSTNCGCVRTKQGVQAIFDTLLTSPRVQDLHEAYSQLDAWTRCSCDPATQAAYTVATSFMAVAESVMDSNDEENAERVGALFRSGKPETFFEPLSPKVKLALLETFGPLDSSNVYTKSLVDAVNKDVAENKFSDVDLAIVNYNEARLLEESDKVAAIRKLSDAVVLFSSLQIKLSIGVKNTGWLEPEHGVFVSDLNVVIKNRISAHQELVKLYVEAKDPLNARINFEEMIELPTPVPRLIDNAEYACEALNDQQGLRVVKSLQLVVKSRQPTDSNDDVRSALRSLSCFHKDIAKNDLPF